jgi:hypothetical protein
VPDSRHPELAGRSQRNLAIRVAPIGKSGAPRHLPYPKG